MPLGELRGGVERMLVNLLRANRKEEHAEYTICFLQPGPLVEEVRALGYAVKVIEAGRLRQPYQYVQTILALRAWLQREGVRAVVSWAAKGHLYAGPAALSLGLPSAWYVHSLPDGYWMDRLVTMIPATRVFCCGRSAEQAQQKMWPRRATRVVYIAVDLERFNPDQLPAPGQARAQLRLPEDVPLVGMVARLQRWKGVHVFVEAAARVAQRHPDARFVVVGGSHWSEPEYPEELRQQARQQGIEERVLFVGQQDNVPLWMQAADVLVHASFDEPTGTVIIEGMAMGKPVVAARTAGPMEFVEEGQNGMLASPGNAEELAQVMNHLIDRPCERSRLGAAARSRAAYFSADRLALDLASSLEEMLA